MNDCIVMYTYLYDIMTICHTVYIFHCTHPLRRFKDLFCDYVPTHFSSFLSRCLPLFMQQGAIDLPQCWFGDLSHVFFSSENRETAWYLPVKMQRLPRSCELLSLWEPQGVLVWTCVIYKQWNSLYISLYSPLINCESKPIKPDKI